MPSPTRFRRSAIAIAALVTISACSGKDARLEKLTAGISKDSVIAAMGGQQPQRTDAFLTGGHFIEAMYFAGLGKTDSASLADRNMSPAVLSDGKLLAWGWPQWDSIAAANKIQVAKARDQ